MPRDPAKSSGREVEDVVKTIENSAKRIMLNTDSGTQIFNDLEAYLRKHSLPLEIIQNITRNNAAAFFNISIDG